jgi:hypothetical protein
LELGTLGEEIEGVGRAGEFAAVEAVADSLLFLKDGWLDEEVVNWIIVR